MSTDAKVTKHSNKKRKMTEGVIKAGMELQKHYPSFWRHFSGYRNSQDIAILYRMKTMCDVLGINFNDTKPIVLRFINCKDTDKSVKMVSDKKLRTDSKEHQ